MKLFRKILRYWIGIASVFSFLGGWVILAHSPKPVHLQPATGLQPTGLPALPSLPPIQPYSATTSSGLTFFSTPVPTNPPATNIQPIQPIQPFQNIPILRTGGS